MRRRTGLSWLSVGIITAATGVAFVSCSENASVDQVDAALSRHPGRACATPHPSANRRANVQRQLDAFRAARSTSGASAASIGPTEIDVWVHVITDGNNGNISDQVIYDTIDFMNLAYAGYDEFAWDGRTPDASFQVGTPFSFNLAGITRNDNSTWFYAGIGSNAEQDMKSTLRVGGAATLNIYSTEADGYLGWATFPSDYDFDPDYDGVVCYWGSFTGAMNWDYGYGDTHAHEIGHWLGLYHTFQGGCGGQGDQVEDTPAERSYAFGCPNDPDTCKQDPGLDPIYNYMDYTDDLCMFGFTAGQDARMQDLFSLHRDTGPPPPPECQVNGDCDDNQACTTNVCDNGTCVYDPVVCSDTGDPCTVETCNPANGQCEAGPGNEGGSCDDNDACTGPDECNAGVCGGDDVVCDDNSDCTDDSCDSDSGCVHTPNGTCTDDEAHVGDLAGNSINNGKTWTAEVTITVHGVDHAPVADAFVSGLWNGSGAGSCTTDAGGTCTVSLGGTRKKVGSVDFSVTNITAVGRTYDYLANHETDITVYKP